MRGSPLTIVVGFLLLLAVSTGAGYSVGASVNGSADDVAAPPSTSTTTGAAGGSSTTAAAEPATTSPPTTPAPATTTTEAGPRRPTAEDPLRIVLAGDSVMAGLAPALKAAVEADGTSQVRFVLTPSILRDPTVRFKWNQELEGFNPEVIVMFVGTWESEVLRTGTGAASTDPTWRTQYEANVLDPWLQLITSRGASVIWIGNPAVGNAEANAAFAALNEAYAELPDRWPSVTYLSAQEPLNGPAPGFHDVITGDDGSWVRTRQIDGLHLCPAGAALLAEEVVRELTSVWKANEAPNWQDGDWRGADVYPGGSCPAPSLP
jgi:hypothetical protein